MTLEDLNNQLNLKNQNVVWEYLHSLYALSISDKHTLMKFNNELDLPVPELPIIKILEFLSIK